MSLFSLCKLLFSFGPSLETLSGNFTLQEVGAAVSCGWQEAEQRTWKVKTGKCGVHRGLCRPLTYSRELAIHVHVRRSAHAWARPEKALISRFWLAWRLASGRQEVKAKAFLSHKNAQSYLYPSTHEEIEVHRDCVISPLLTKVGLRAHVHVSLCIPHLYLPG